MADEAELLSKFCNVTGTDESNAKAYLEAANHDLETALQHFFHEDGDQWGVNEPSTARQVDQKPNTVQPKPTKNRFGTVAGLNRSSSDDSEDEAESRDAFYAGGSTHSGQQVLGPRSQPSNQIVNEMFRSAREHGAQVLNQSEPGSSQQGTLKFAGTGYRLGQTSGDSQVVSGSSINPLPRQEMIIKLKMWKQGFSIDDGPLRKYSEPANVQFLKTVSRGEIPDELLRQAQGNEIQLSMEDHSHEDFNIAKPKLKAFWGQGNILGSPVPGETQKPPLTPSENRVENEARAREIVKIDSNLPTTNVQIRLSDGSRLIATLNQTHTIADIRTYIITARPEYETVSFNLLTSFPSKILSEEKLTLAEAQILNASLMQRLV